jgi:soluble lytic murein transglycosylase-like protein
LHSIDTKRPTRTGHEGLRELVRRPLVGALLVMSAVAQVVAVGAKARIAGEAAPGVVARLAPWVVEAPAAAPVKAAVPAAPSVNALVAHYRSQGYEVSGSLARTIGEAAERYDIDPDVAFGLVRAESGFRNGATSRVGAVGLTQLMPGTARWLEPGTTRSDLRDPETNVEIGFKYLRSLIDRFHGDVDLALTAYNRGPGTVDRVLKRGGDPDNGYADFVRTGKRGRHRG